MSYIETILFYTSIVFLSPSHPLKLSIDTPVTPLTHTPGWWGLSWQIIKDCHIICWRAYSGRVDIHEEWDPKVHLSNKARHCLEIHQGNLLSAEVPHFHIEDFFLAHIMDDPFPRIWLSYPFSYGLFSSLLFPTEIIFCGFRLSRFEL